MPEWNEKFHLTMSIVRWHLAVLIGIVVVLVLLSVYRIVGHSVAYLDRAWLSTLIKFILLQLVVWGVESCRPYQPFVEIEERLLLGGIVFSFYYAFVVPWLFPNSVRCDI